MLRIIQSNRMENLQAHLNALLQVAPLDNPFSKEVVLVQSPGMSQWLKIGLCEALGIAAQVDFPLPSSFIWGLYQKLLPDVPAESAFNKPNMAWKLYNLLPDCIAQPQYEALQNYLNDDVDGVKRFLLCEKIADVFDQYLMYRPAWLSLWQAGQDTLPDVDISLAPWQPDLWRRLIVYTEQLGQSHYHRANMHELLLAALSADKVIELPERITLFGISALPPSQLQIFTALATRCEVLLYLFNPSEHYWGDVVDEKLRAKLLARYTKAPVLNALAGQHLQVGNPLLSSWGKLGRDYLEQLVQLDAQWLDYFATDFDNNLLQTVQREIYDLAFKGESQVDDSHWYVNDVGRFALADEDQSIRFQDCHTALREVECLHDYLLDCLHQDPSLTPKDIIVMMPDVGQYSPYIEAVFGGARGNRQLPYAIADLAIAQERPILQSFVSLVNLPFSRFQRSDVLDLLAVDAIASRFELSSDEFAQLNYWLDRASVKWGIDGEHKQEYQLPTIALNTWWQGLNKLLLGVALADESIAYNGLYPLDEVEGMASATLSKLIAFIGQLIAFKAQLAKPDTLRNKASLLRTLQQAFYDAEHEDSWDLMQIQQVIDELEKHYDNGDNCAPIAAKTLAYLVEQGLKEKGVGQRFLVGSVNFCTLMPMRAVPFKVVCLLGMNDSDYPRQVQPLGFDLVASSIRQKGDRSRKLDDRYLFLEALLSARKRFYLSYIGRSCFNNEPQVPSVLVSELVEYIDRVFYLPTNPAQRPSHSLTWQAPLQPFDNKHYQAGPWHSFNPIWHWQLAPQVATEERSALPVELPSELEISQWLRGVLAPQALYYQATLGVKLQPIAQQSDDDEPFALDALDRYQYLQQLLDNDLAAHPINPAQWLQQGRLGQSQVGVIQLATMQQRVAAMASIIKPFIAEPQAPLEVRLQIGGTTLVGWLDKLYGRHQVFYRSASVKAKDLIRGFIYHCLAGVVAEPVTTLVIGLDSRFEFAALDKATCQHYLSTWLTFYHQALSAPQPFFANSSYEYAKTQDLQKAQLKFEGGQYIGLGDSEDPYVALCFKEFSEFSEPFMAQSELLLTDLVRLATEIPHADT
ncbi:exodeoxyribonuclease V subunit gamma [Pseudoalteromonas fenneropenaei]|uniref:RecBCD enzyme subunit RecC n=1 Tax=Pseudoalteromonas fenneropenaei TaxID=1737459 RepID=A0ABV7CPZ2_9GAMM